MPVGDRRSRNRIQEVGSVGRCFRLATSRQTNWLVSYALAGCVAPQHLPVCILLDYVRQLSHCRVQMTGPPWSRPCRRRQWTRPMSCVHDVSAASTYDAVIPGRPCGLSFTWTWLTANQRWVGYTHLYTSRCSICSFAPLSMCFSSYIYFVDFANVTSSS